MHWERIAAVVVTASTCLLLLGAQERYREPLAVEHSECAFFGSGHARFAYTGLRQRAAQTQAAGVLTVAVVQRLGGNRFRVESVPSVALAPPAGLIDSYIFAALQDAGVTPAPAAGDYEFLRRATLDLTGRIPTADQVVAFVQDTSPDKRAKLVDDLLSRAEWVDKWTMFFGDLYGNVDRNTQVTRYEQGRNAFYYWIHDSLVANKPYDQMARELIAAKGDNGWDPVQGNLNYLVGGIVTGGPVQDIFDQQAANVARNFLGLANMNCVMCHNGRGHLDQLNLWAAHTARYQAWQFSSFFSHTSADRTPATPGMPTPYYYLLADNTRYKADYALNTTTGNRPARQPVGTEKNVAPAYFFTGEKPAGGESYRDALARILTADPQFARAAVNYVWKQFFNRGLVEPVDQFDPARLDPDNPPPAPWTLQPSNARLLNALASAFQQNGFDLKWLMRQIANSRAYQLSARYSGDWNPAWEPLFARKLVRRLWAEEIHDAIVQSSNVPASYSINMATAIDANPVKIGFAMQLPQPVRMPAGAAGAFLDYFLRGNRDDQDRSGEGSVLESLALKNDAFVMTRIRATGTAASGSLLAQKIQLPDPQLVESLFLAVLSRKPDDAELNAALNALKTGDRQKAAEDLLWTLYNKVDFVFNY